MNTQQLVTHEQNTALLAAAINAGQGRFQLLAEDQANVTVRKGSRVLVVDDSAVERVHLSNMLDDLGMRVLEATSGSEAIATALREKPDMIFLDIIMGDMDGFNACRELTSSAETAQIPVVMVSSKKNRADKMWATEQGARGYIVKPCTEDDIKAALGLE